MPDDTEVWKGIVQGDADSYDAFYRSNAPRLRAFLRQIVGSTQAAEDIAQETFTQLWMRPQGFDPERGTLRSYLYGIGRKRAADWWRKHKAGDELQEDRADRPRIEMNSIVADAFRRLPEEQRMLLWLREIEGQSYTELAATLSIPIGTVRSRLFAAREALRTIWRSQPKSMEEVNHDV